MIYKCKYFSIKELVSPVVYDKWGEQSWMFFEESVLQDLDLIRESWGSPIIINKWSAGLKQCGLRSNLDEITKGRTNRGQLYLSGHVLGKGFDLHDSIGRNLKLYDHVLKMLKQKSFKSLKRIENWEQTYTGGGWVHVDSLQSDNIVF